MSIARDQSLPGTQVSASRAEPAHKSGFDLRAIICRAHAEASANDRSRMSYRNRFRSALRRAWRDAQMGAFEAKIRAEKIAEADLTRTEEDRVAPFAQASVVDVLASTCVRSHPAQLPPRPG